MAAPIKNLRWYIAGLLCLSTSLNYLDRNSLSVLAVTIQKELGISTVQYSYVTSSFLFAYMIMYVIGGWIVDRLGTRRGLLVFATGWSFANMAHALARTATMLSGFRFLLGVTEAANIPAGVKAVTEWFPVRERAMAVGIFNAGTAIGGALAVPVVSLIAATMGWRSAFVVTGAIGLVWVLAWAVFYQLPAQHPRLGADELALITADDREVPGTGGKVPIARLLAMPETWGCIAVRVLTDPISYFLNFWMAKYLQDERHFNLKDLAVSAWIPFVALALGNLASGAIPRALVARGMALDRARKRTMLGVALGMPLACYLVTRVSSAPAAVAVLSLVFFGHAAFGNVTMPAEVFPKRVVATVSGLGGTLGALSGWLTQLAIGKVVQALGFRPVFAAVSVLYLVAFVFIAGLVKDLGRIRDLT